MLKPRWFDSTNRASEDPGTMQSTDVRFWGPGVSLQAGYRGALAPGRSLHGVFGDALWSLPGEAVRATAPRFRPDERQDTGSGAVANARVTAYLRSLARRWKHARVAQLRFRSNVRLKTTVARLLANDGLIEFNQTVAHLGARDQREVLCHEAAHFVVLERHGRSARPHGAEWAALVKLAGFEPRASRVKCGQPKERHAAKQPVRHTCPVCHFSKRAARRMPRWRCPECRALGLDGSLRIERLSR
jgi:predicted SprT family Zn-dependent metalloprotease